MRQLLIVLFLLAVSSPLAAQHLEISSTWHTANQNQWLLFNFDGPELVDTHDLHAAGSPDIVIATTGYYWFDLYAVVGLGFPRPFPLGTFTDRMLRLERIDISGNRTVLTEVRAARNTTSQAFMRIGPFAEFLLVGGDRLRLLFRYATGEDYFGVIVPQFKLEFVRVSEPIPGVSSATSRRSTRRR